MPQKLDQYWEYLRTSFWFLPAMMAVAAALLAPFMVWLDEVMPQDWISALEWLYTGSAEGARQLLATVAGSMITVAGVVFSITIVALTLASTQFGPRLLRNFMRDRGNQIVLGTFISTFVYCLLVLRTVRGADDGGTGGAGAFVPHAAVTLAIVLALLSLGVLIYFIHHASTSMQAPTIIANVSAELRHGIDSLFPDELGGEPGGELGQKGDDDESNDAQGGQRDVPLDFADAAAPVASRQDGYVQFINDERLMQLAREHDLVVRIMHRPGHFVVKGEPLARAWPRRGEQQRIEDEIRGSFSIGSQQTPRQDVEFVINQLVEVAVRALSPGINDPFTAVTCIDYLGAALARLEARRIPSPYRRDEDGRLRVIACGPSFTDIADTAFRQIRQHGRTNPAVLARMLESIAMVLRRVRRAEDRDALLHHALLIKQIAERLPQAADRDDIQGRYEALNKQ